MFIKCFTCKNPLYDHIHEICVNILFCVMISIFMVKCCMITLYVKIFLSQSVPLLINYTTICSLLLSKCKFILNSIFGIDFVW